MMRISLHLILFLALGFYSSLSMSTCPSNTADISKGLFEKGFYFYAYRVPGTLELFSPRAQSILEKHYQCVDTGELCAPGSVPWLDTQDGDFVEPFNFESVHISKETEQVKFTYNFGFSPEAIIRSQTVKLIFTKIESCWLIDDFITPNGRSLFDLWSKEYGLNTPNQALKAQPSAAGTPQSGAP